MVTLRSIVTTVLLGLFFMPSLALANGDPLRSPGWNIMVDRFFKDQKVVHDARVQVSAPPGAEDSTAVPGFVRVSGIDNVERILVFADLNPIPRILEMRPQGAELAIGFKFKVQQATPVRAAVQTSDGTWYVGSTWVDAAGGGCTAPTISSASAGWQDRLGELVGQSWKGDNGIDRVSFSVMHPMDTGLVAGIPLFHVEEITVHGDDGKLLATIAIDSAMSENPELTMEVPGQQSITIRGHDNNGNRFSGVL